MTLANNQNRLRKWGFLTDKSSGYGPNTEAAYTAALDKLETLWPLPKPSIPPHPKVPMEVILGAIDAQKQYGIPSSVTMAQWALESGWGQSVSGKWNYGGITAKVKDAVFPFVPGTPLEPATLCWTHEVVGGKSVKCQRWFKDFDSPAAYFEAHAKLVGTAKVYAPARAKLPNVDAFVETLGPIYATAPNYASLIKSIMKSNDLYKYNDL